MIFPQRTLNCAGRLISLERPLIMGIINATPDSFFTGSQLQSSVAAVAKAEQILEDGADIIDIGGMSSRPGAKIISVEEELDRVMPVITSILKTFPETIVSIDTVHAIVAKEAVQAGASIVNDVSAGKIDPDMYDTVAELDVPYIVMHMQGRPDNMQQQASYDNVVVNVLEFLIEEVYTLRSKGVKDIIVDPGFGFGKTIDHNYQLLHQLHVLHIMEVPILVGLSRKSMIHKVLQTSPDTALNGTTALHMLALQQGAHILRVHDVAPAVEVVQLWERYRAAQQTVSPPSSIRETVPLTKKPNQ